MHPSRLAKPGPTLVTANHPNSFLDAIIIGASFDYPIHFLARGDAFTKPWHAKLLGLLQMIPVYRLSEGKENLGLNEQAFSKSKEILSSGGILLIFIEGICVNKHALQPFRKGAARIATDCKEIPGLTIMPLGIAYNSFTSFGKEIVVDPGEPIPVKELLPFEEDTRNMRYMNELLYKAIEEKVHVPIPGNEAVFPFWSIPAQLGRLLNRPLYYFLKKKIAAKTRGTVFFDSVLFGALMLFYPFYLLLIFIVLCLFSVPGTIALLIVLLFPLTAYLAVRQKNN